VLVEKVKHGFVATLVLLAHLSILQVRASSHPAVDLGGEGLDVVRRLEVGLERLDVLGNLVLGGQDSHGDVHGLGVVGVDHGGVALHSRLEEPVVLAGRQSSDLTAPAVAQDGPVKAAAGRELVGLGHDVGDLGEGIRGGSLGLEEVAELLLMFIRLRREPGDIGRLALEEVGHEDTVFLLVGIGQDVGSLDGLREETEDV